jgi:hypothetical protein
VIIVFFLSVGPHVGLLCRALCDPHAAAATGCHHDQAAALLTIADESQCSDVLTEVAAVVRDDGRRVSAVPVQLAAVALFDLTVPATGALPRGRHGVAPRSDSRPLVTALRI